MTAMTSAEWQAYLNEMDPVLDRAEARIGEEWNRRRGRKPEPKRDPSQAEIKRAIVADAKIAKHWKKWGEKL